MFWTPCSTTGVKPRLKVAGNMEKPGFTLVEILISVSIFVMIILSATQIFKMVIDAQRSAIASQNVEESLKYFLEVTAKEMRTAKKNEGACPGIGNKKIFATSTNSYGDVLRFKNYYGQCVTYSLALDYNGVSKRFLITRGSGGKNDFGYISPQKIMIDSLHFFVKAETSTQPTVTVNLRAHALDEAQFKSDMIIQTTISSRYYK